jgi:hypothetical protein
VTATHTLPPSTSCGGYDNLRAVEVHGIKVVEDTRKRSASDAARLEHGGTGAIERCRFVGALAVDASVYPSPPALQLTPAQRASRETMNGRVVGGKETPHSVLPQNFIVQIWLRKPDKPDAVTARSAQ